MGVTGRLKNAEGFVLGDINDKRSKHFFSGKLRLFYFNGCRCSVTKGSKQHIAVNRSERQLLVLLKIIIHLNRLQVVNPDKLGKRHFRIRLLMHLEVCYQVRNTQQLVPFTISGKVHQEECYGENAFQRGECT